MKQTPNPTPNGTKPPANAEAATVKTLDNGPAVIVFGNNEQRIPQAAWFPASEAPLATRAARLGRARASDRERRAPRTGSAIAPGPGLRRRSDLRSGCGAGSV